MQYSEKVLKGRIAETIVSGMLMDAGYFVYRFGYEGILQSFVQKGLPKMNKGDLEAEKVRTMPDFIVMKDGDVSFVEVKFRSSSRLDQKLQQWTEKAVRYWPEARLILVRPEEPCFSISTVRQFAKTWKLFPLVKDRYVKVDREIIKEYELLISKYCEKQMAVVGKM